jgi:hypothetical protein
MMQQCVSSLKLIAQVVSLDVLGQIIKLHVPLCIHHSGLAVVFSVVGANPIVLVVNVNVAVGVEDFAHLALLIRFQGGDAPFAWPLR